MKRFTHLLELHALHKQIYAQSELLWRHASRGEKRSNNPSETRLQHIDEHFESIPPEQRNKRTFNAAIGICFTHNFHLCTSGRNSNLENEKLEVVEVKL